MTVMRLSGTEVPGSGQWGTEVPGPIDPEVEGPVDLAVDPPGGEGNGELA